MMAAQTTNILVIGDIISREGREVVIEFLPKLIVSENIDFVIANVDNAAHGFGMNKLVIDELKAAGVDVFTCGNHVFDQKDADLVLMSNRNVLRPMNYPETTPGHGVYILQKRSVRLLVIHAMGQVFFPIHGNDPFYAVKQVVSMYKMPSDVQAIVVDFHAETTAEKNAMGHFLDGKVSAVVGTHTHIPTADARILEFGTAFQTDIGMCGVYDSVIGMQKQSVIRRFVEKKNHGNKMEPAIGKPTFCGTLIQVNLANGLATKVRHLVLNEEFRCEREYN